MMKCKTQAKTTNTYAMFSVVLVITLSARKSCCSRGRGSMQVLTFDALLIQYATPRFINGHSDGLDAKVCSC